VRDLYEILGVGNDASDDDIKRAYRKRARELHPDTGGDEEAFKELTTAYEVLKNPQARANYDRFGDPRGPQGAGVGDPFSGFGDLSDLIDAFFGGGFGGGAGARRGGTARARGGRDAVLDVRVTLEEAAEGVQRDVELTVPRPCDTCAGRGAAPGTDIVTCTRCEGTGAVQQVARSVFGQMLTSAVCPDCAGAGTKVSEPCPDCRGEGRRQTTETATIDVPPGVDNGVRLRLSGRGEAGRQGAPSGDLYVRVHVSEHPVFERDGADLHCRMSLPMTQAALGIEVPFDTLYGKETLRVPPGTQPGAVLSVRRAGMPKLNGGGARGDLHVHCEVEVPKRLAPDEAELLEQLAKLRGEDEPHGGRDGDGLLGRFKRAFGG
jgi:molecular chaperone DnaJ